MSESEQSPSTNHELAASHVSVESFEQQMLEAGQPVDAARADVERAQEKVDALNFKSDATDHVYAKAELRDAKTALAETEAAQQPVIDDMNDQWLAHGGARVDAARAAVEALNFKSDATDHVYAKAELRDAKAAWEESYNASKTESAVEEAAEAAPEATTEEPSAPEAAELNTPETDGEAEEPASVEEDAGEVHEGVIVDDAMTKEIAVVDQPDMSKELVVIDQPTTSKELVAVESQPEQKAKLWTWKDMLLRPGRTLSVAIDDYRRVRAERRAAEADYSDDTKRKENLRRGRNIMFGTLAVVATAVLFKETADAAGHLFSHAQDVHAGVGDAFNNGAGNHNLANPPHEVIAPAPAPSIDTLFSGTNGSTEFTQGGLNNAHEWLQGYQVKQGDTIWSLAEQYLKTHGMPNPDVYHIDAVKDSLEADLQNRGVVGANGWLMTGQTLRF